MKNLKIILSYLLVAIIASMITLAVFCPAPTENVAPATEEYNKLDDLTHVIDTYFIGEADHTAMEDAAAAAMVEALDDRWSYYMTAADYQAYIEQMQNSYVGIGITIMSSEDISGLEVIKVNEGSPAEEAGMLAGDVIIAVEGQSVIGMMTTEVRNLVRGQEGTQVLIGIRRGEETMDLSITRKTVQTPVAEWKLLDEGIGLITIYNFDDRCAQETIAAIESLLAQGAQGLILDVRNNPGGYKHELVKLLDYLLPEGPLFRSEDYRGNVEVDESDANCLEIPMTVLINADTYSAAEFFAAALSEYDAAKLVGEKTFGKGHFQTSFTLDDGSAIVLSIGKYTTPKGVSLVGTGLTPDIPVEVDEETAYRIYLGLLDPAEDPQLQAAIAALLGNE